MIVSVPVIQEIVRLFVQATPYTVASQVFNDFVPFFCSLGLHKKSQIRNSHTTLDTHYSPVKNILGGVYQFLMSLHIFSKHKRAGIVCPITIKFCRNINIHQIALFQNTLARRDTMTKLMTNTDTSPSRKTIGQKRCRFRSELPQYLCTIIIQFLCSHTYLRIFFHSSEGMSDSIAHLLHPRQFGFVCNRHLMTNCISWKNPDSHPGILAVRAYFHMPKSVTPYP